MLLQSYNIRFPCAVLTVYSCVEFLNELVEVSKNSQIVTDYLQVTVATYSSRLQLQF